MICKCGTCKFWIKWSMSDWGDCTGPAPAAYNLYDRERMYATDGEGCPVWVERPMAYDLTKAEDRDRLLRELVDVLSRYRTETPLGHQPHMISGDADTLIERARSAIAAGYTLAPPSDPDTVTVRMRWDGDHLYAAGAHMGFIDRLDGQWRCRDRIGAICGVHSSEAEARAALMAAAKKALGG
jgi:hypothetical protein